QRRHQQQPPPDEIAQHTVPRRGPLQIVSTVPASRARLVSSLSLSAHCSPRESHCGRHCHCQHIFVPEGVPTGVDTVTASTSSSPKGFPLGSTRSLPAHLRPRRGPTGVDAVTASTFFPEA